MKYQILENGDLEITGKVNAKDYIYPDSNDALADALEPVTTNGLSWVLPEDIGALTSSPILTDGDPENPENVWWYPNYALRSPLQDLIETGRTIFTKGA